MRAALLVLLAVALPAWIPRRACAAVPDQPPDFPSDPAQYAAGLDALARAGFDSAETTLGLTRLDVGPDPQVSSVPLEALHAMLADRWEDNPDVALPVNSSTNFQLLRANYSTHPDGLELRVRAVELTYVFAASLSSRLAPATRRIFRRGGQKFVGIAGPRSVEKAEIAKDTFLRPVLRRTNGSSLIELTPFDVNIIGQPVLGSPNFGRPRIDCSSNLVGASVRDVGAFGTVQREDCIVAGLPWEDEEQCFWGLSKCRAPPCPDDYVPAGDLDNSCCSPDHCCSGRHSYDPKAPCALVEVQAENISPDFNTTVWGQVELQKAWAAPNGGTGHNLQSVAILVRTSGGRNQISTQEAIDQQASTSKATEDATILLASALQDDLFSRPTPIDLTLVVASQLAGAMAVDSGKLYRMCIPLGSYLFAKLPGQHKKFLLVSAWLIALLASIPGILVTIIIIYLEVSGARLNRSLTATAWHRLELYPETKGERVYWIRRVLLTAELSSSKGIRYGYVIIPALMLVLEVGVEVVLSLAAYRVVTASM